MFDHRSTPADIWQIILDGLPRSDHRTCLRVSKELHDCVLPRLFRTVKIYFGIWSPDFPTAFDTNIFGNRWRLYSSDEPCPLPSMSWDILRRISTDVAFARVVRKLMVYSYTLAGPVVFERRCLIEALEALPHLRSFVWRGNYPELPADIPVALTECCPSLEELGFSVPMSSPPLPLHGLKSLHSLSVYWDMPWEYELGEEGDISRSDGQGLIQANAETLRELCIYGDLLWKSPIRILRDLTHLELVNATNLDNVDLLFHHSVQLQSLALVPADPRDRHFLNAFRGDPNALPYLTSLKIIVPEGIAQHVDGFLAFVQAKKKLRRFDLCVSCQWQEVISLLSVLRNLHHLEVLGFDLQSYDDLSMADQLSDIRDHMPQNLTALRLDTCVSQSKYNTEWVDLFTKCANLQFLRHSGLGVLDLQDTCDALEHLQFISEDEAFMTVARADGKAILSDPWSLRKVVFRTVEDLGCEDWEWVIRYHKYGLDLIE